MLLSGVLFVLFLAGCWLYCLTDAALTPAREYRGLRKATWIGIIATTFIAGAIAWLIVRRSWRARSLPDGYADFVTLASHGDGDLAWPAQWTAADAIARHPAGRSRKPGTGGWAVPRGPDDDPEFLRVLDRRIRGTSADAGDLTLITRGQATDPAAGTAGPQPDPVPATAEEYRREVGRPRAP